jgi:membrane associated rhomboid family serine protease
MTSGPKTLPYKILEPPPPPPLITILLMVTMVFFVADGNINWTDKVCFSATKMSEQMGNPVQLMQLMFIATFSQLSNWICVLNALFIWAFGHVVEKQLKALRYLAFVLVILFSGWLLVFVLSGVAGASKMYVGPSMLMFGLLGGYFAFLPKRPFKPQAWVKSPTQIYSTEQEVPMHERYWVSPWAYIITFVVYQVILQVSLFVGVDAIVDKTHMDFLRLIYTQALGRMNSDSIPYAFQPMAAIGNIAVGVFCAALLPKLAMVIRPKRPGGKLQLEVIQHYRELRTLDMTHEQACEGAAKFAAVPIDTATDWIVKGAAGLKDQDLR